MVKANQVLNDVLIAVLQKLVWADIETRRKLQEHGVSVTPSNFYSTIPSIKEVEESYEYSSGQVPYPSEQLFSDRRLLEELIALTTFSTEFSPPREGEENSCTNFFWNNSQFSYSDAMSYYSFIRRYKPARVVEIGSGFSSLVAIEALQKNQEGELFCIEPYPRPFLLQREDIRLMQKKAQDVSVEELNELLRDGDILFIDSTHTVKTGSDCLHIYLRLLPMVKHNIIVHVHDIFLPFGMPKSWILEHQLFWTEQYLLLALLTDNHKCKVLFGSAYHMARNATALGKFMHDRNSPGGSSFWFKYSGHHS